MLTYILAEIDSIDRPNDPRYVRRSCHEEARRIQSIKQGCEVIEHESREQMYRLVVT